MPPKAKRKDILPARNGNSAKDNAVHWPPLKPLVPADQLQVHEVVSNQILTIANFFTTKLCKDYVSFLSSLPLVTTPGRPKRGEATRVNDRFQVDDVGFAERLWSETALKELVLGFKLATMAESDTATSRLKIWGGEPIGLNPNIRVYRYTKGQFFDQHYDDSNKVLLPGPPPTEGKTTWTLLIYLTSPATGCQGGETVFYPEPSGKKKSSVLLEPVVVGLEVGMALLHRHGADCMLHEGREVLAGEKWVIRSDLVVRG